MLGCVCIQKNLQGERDWEDELSTGLIEQAEADRLMTMTATVSVRDKKADKFPTRVRASYFFYYLHKEVYDLFAAHDQAFSPVRAMVEADIGRMTGCFESIELLNMTVLASYQGPSQGKGRGLGPATSRSRSPGSGL